MATPSSSRRWTGSDDPPRTCSPYTDELRDRGAGLRVLNLSGGDVDTATPMGSMLFTIMAAFAQMEHEIERERVTDSISKRREAGKDLGGRPRRVTDSQIRSAVRLVEGGEPAAQVVRDLGRSRATYFIDGREHSRTSRVASPLERHQANTERRQRAIKSTALSCARPHIMN
jgi:DNA invertase Pin-like site-specific DNA recombinase